jgi:P-type Cu2+ transporter
MSAASAASRLVTSSPAAALPVPCAHCGDPVASPEPNGSGLAFCCAGCRSVFEIVQAAGLTDYYSQPDRRAARPTTSARKYQELDDPGFQQQHCRELAGGQRSVELLLEGVHCSACVWLVERLGRVVAGVISSRLDISRSVVELVWDPRGTTLSALARGLESLGYPAHALGTPATTVAKARDRDILLRLGVAGAAAGNVMLMALALYSGAFSGMEAAYQALFRWGSLLIATPAVFWAGAVFLRGGLSALRTRTPHMDLPVSIGILTGYAGGAFNTVMGRGEIYFDTLCTLIFLLLIGRYLQQSHHRRSSSRSELLLALAPQTAHLVEADIERDVPAGSVPVRALVRIAAGERIPVDGLVDRGAGSVDTSLLTGEPMPAEVRVADRVYAGTACETGELWVRVEAAGDATRLGQLMASVEATQRQRAPIVRLADQVAGHFVIAILAVAALTLALWLHLDPGQAVDHTIALLVVTCPCALGMATPLSISAALGRAAKSGILFKGGEYVEELAKRGTLVFDKTGTLTAGRPELVAWLGDAALQAPLRAAEAQCTHPLARAIQRAFEPNALRVEQLVELPRGGIAARVEGVTLLVGSPALLLDELGSLPAWATRLVMEHAEAGRTPVLVAADGKLGAVAAFGDAIRPEAAENLSRLRALGYDFEILSGDHPSVVRGVADQLHIPRDRALGGQSPEAKLERVAQLRRQGPVIMVGDGVNDAGAMAAASVGFAVHGGAETCLRAADVFATRTGIGPVTDAVVGARRTLAAIRRGIAISLGYNLVGIGLAVSGLLGPLLAAVLMPLSSISVVSLALRARTFEQDPP